MLVGEETATSLRKLTVTNGIWIRIKYQLNQAPIVMILFAAHLNIITYDRDISCDRGHRTEPSSPNSNTTI
ncbi:unnamed protein product [Gongylonema pulchrum]|uniref:Uncharacterized protein n=1 Tax=Gongylonema pulchrum TaxID=637853 RepID=A0A183D0Q8_9BILA|nr:unnamed protein product [Gongylonema pulchrum]